MEAYIDFIDRLQEAIERQIDNDRAAKSLLWQLVYENANKDYRAVIGPLELSPKTSVSLSRLAKISAQSIIRLLSWLLQLREIPDVTIVESLVTCARTVCPPQKGEKVMTSFPLGIVRTVARAGNGQRNATLNSTKTDYPFRETSNWASTPAPSTPIGAFRTAISIRECREMHSF